MFVATFLVLLVGVANSTCQILRGLTFQEWPTAAIRRRVEGNQPVEVGEALRREGKVGRVLHATGASWKSCNC